MGHNLTVRALAEEDLPLIHRWLNNPVVARWYDVGGVRFPSLEKVCERYLPKLDPRTLVNAYAVVCDGHPVGYIQSYFVRDHPEYAEALKVDDGAVSVDLFIGEDAYRHRGVGTALVRWFLREEVFGRMAADVCVIGPEPDNAAAIRSYEKAGFRYLKTVQVPGEDQPERIMRITRAEFESGGS